MVDNILTKLLGLFLNIAAHMVFSVSSHANITGNSGSNITFKFTFRANVSLWEDSHFAIYRNVTGKEKIAEYIEGKRRDVFDVSPENSSVFWSFTNLKLNDSGSYWASLFTEQGPAKESDKVQLIVQEVNRSSTVPPREIDIPDTENSGSSSQAVAVLLVSALVLLTVALPCLIWSLVTTTGLGGHPCQNYYDRIEQIFSSEEVSLHRYDKQQLPPPRQSFNPTALETVEASINVPAAAMVYSVLDFPKRSSAVSDVNPNDTEYAAVSYLPEKRLV